MFLKENYASPSKVINDVIVGLDSFNIPGDEGNYIRVQVEI